MEMRAPPSQELGGRRAEAGGVYVGMFLLLPCLVGHERALHGAVVVGADGHGRGRGRGCSAEEREERPHG